MNAALPAAVVGGGVAGLACALLLRRSCGWEVAVAERSAPGKSESGNAPQRALALSPGARARLAECGLWSDGRAVPCHEFSRMVVWSGEGVPKPGNRIIFDAAELGAAFLGCIVREVSLRRALWELAGDCPGIQLHSAAALDRVEIREERGLLLLEDGSEIAAELLVGADGAGSRFRQALSIGFEWQGYGQKGLVFEAESEEAAGDTAWQRFSDSATLALLPLGAKRWSIVWSLPDARAGKFLAMGEKNLKAALNEASASVVGKLVPVTPIASFPLRRGSAARVCGERYALVGEAARTVHPLAGQGLNLGLGDAEALARVCAARGDALIGDARVLGRFARERARCGHEMSFGIHAIDAVFGGGAAHLGSLGLAAVNRAAPLKRWLAARAMR